MIMATRGPRVDGRRWNHLDRSRIPYFSKVTQYIPKWRDFQSSSITAKRAMELAMLEPVSIHADAVLHPRRRYFSQMDLGWRRHRVSLRSPLELTKAEPSTSTARSLEIRDGGLHQRERFHWSPRAMLEPSTSKLAPWRSASARVHRRGYLRQPAMPEASTSTAGSVDIRDGGYIATRAPTLGRGATPAPSEVEASDSVFISHAGGDRLSVSDIIGGGAAPTGIYSGTVQGRRQWLHHRQRAGDHRH